MYIDPDMLKHYRKRAGLTQKQLAAGAGVSLSALGKWRKGADLNVSNLLAIMDAINTRLVGTGMRIDVKELLAKGK